MPRRRPPSPLLRALAAAAAVAAALAAHAQPAPRNADDDGSPDSHDAARRVVTIFDFEEKNLDAPDFNPDPVPRYWFRAQDDPGDPSAVPPRSPRPRPGFPAWNTAAFDFSVAASGNASVRLDAAGGSTSLRLVPGVIPVFPGADYAVTARVRTRGADRSRAFLTARFLDAARRPIDGAEVRSAPIASENNWTDAAIELRGEFPNAAFLQIDLELLQPREFRPQSVERLGRHAVQLDDIDASAWFDDVAVFLVPRVTLACDAPGNVTVAPNRPVIRFAVRDMVGDTPLVRLTVRDIDGAPVCTHTAEMDPSGRSLTWAPDLPGLGWYTVAIEVMRDEASVAAAQTQIAWLPAPGPSRALDAHRLAEARRFGLAADDAPPGLPAWPDFLPHVARAVGAGFLILPHADPTAAPNQLARSLGLDRSPLDELLDQGHEVTLSFAAAPMRLADALRIDPRDTLALARHGEEVWTPLLLPILDQYGQRILRWQIGPSNNAAYAAGHPNLRESLAAFDTGLSRLVPGPVLTIPWRAGLPPPPAHASDGGSDSRSTPLDAVTLVLPHDAPLADLAPAVAAWRNLAADADARAPEITIVLEPPPPASARSAAALGELLKRAVEIIRLIGEEPPGSPPLRAAVLSPWRWSDGQRPAPLPEPQLALWRTVTDHLAGRRIVTELPVAPGVRCVVLADAADEDGPGDATDLRPQRGALVAWNDGASETDAVLHAYLGENPLTRIDLFGNAVPLTRNDDPAGTYTIPIPRTPVIIEGIDPRMVRFLASFRIAPSFASAMLTVHEHDLVLENPWPIRISGQLQIVSPDPNAPGWTISPAGIIPFDIAPGATARIPISFSFRASEETGRKTFSILVKLTADRTYPAQLLSAPLDIGSETLDFAAEAALSDDGEGPDVIVTATVTNRGDHPRTVRLDASAPGRPTQQFPVSNLGPGETAVRRFVFKDAAPTLAGKRIRVSLADAEAPERLNVSVTVP